MNSRNVTKFCVFILTIFVAEIASAIAKRYIQIHTGHKDPYVLTAIQMGIIIAIYYPVFTFINKIAENISKHFIRKTKQATGSSSLGLIIAFLSGLGIIYVVFLKMWYNIALWEVLWRKI
jgi:hypothetical protein